MKPIHAVCSFFGFFVLLNVGNPSHAGSLIDDFAGLFERCRISVENSSELDTAGLIPITVPEAAKGSWGADFTQDGWQLPGSGLYVVQTAWTNPSGQTRHLCDIYIEENRPALTAAEQGLLIRHFLVRQTQLIGEGTHQLEQALSPIPPLINLGFLLRDATPNGCIVVNSMALLPDGTAFVAGSGEQAVKPCQHH